MFWEQIGSRVWENEKESIILVVSRHGKGREVSRNTVEQSVMALTEYFCRDYLLEIPKNGKFVIRSEEESLALCFSSKYGRKGEILITLVTVLYDRSKSVKDFAFDADDTVFDFVNCKFQLAKDVLRKKSCGCGDRVEELRAHIL